MLKQKFLVYIRYFLPLLLLSSPSQAGISEFNAAMKQGDYATAAAETKLIWRDFDKTSKPASTLAREFAFVNYLNQDFEAASQFLGHLTGSQEPAIEDDQPAVTAVLDALIQHRQDATDDHYEQLADAVIARTEKPGLDNISLIGMEYLYTISWHQGRWRDTRDYAQEAKAFFDRAGDQLLVRGFQAELLSRAARAIVRTSKNDYEEIADFHDLLVNRIDAEENPQVREGLIDLKWQAQAWVQAMEALYTSHYKQTGSNINSDIRPRDLKSPASNIFADSQPVDDSRPLCNLEFEANKLSYPGSAGFKGMAGSVIVKLDFDEEGKAQNPQLLASVPTKYFAEQVMEVASTFTVEKVDEDEKDCRLAHNNRIQSINFIIQ